MIAAASSSSVHAVWAPDSNVLLIAFTGFAFKYMQPIPRFSFMSSALRFSVNKLFARDLRRVWYHYGLPGIGNGIDEIADYICDRLEQHGIRKVVTVGSSAGSYAALLFGWLLEADEVHAIGPQTYIDFENRLRHEDFFMAAHTEKLYLSDLPQEKYFDLKDLCLRAPNERSRVHIYYCHNSRIDSVHAGRMRDIPNVELHPFDEGGHWLAWHMKQTGELDRVLERALAPRSDRPDPGRSDSGEASASSVEG